MLVRNTHLGAALASKFATATAPDHAVVLMRGHGMTVIGPTIQDCVLLAAYTQNNAAIQTTALLLRAAYRAELAQGQHMGEGIRYLSEEEAEAAMEMTKVVSIETMVTLVERGRGTWIICESRLSLYVVSKCNELPLNSCLC
jgi:ribulose-5-phosphate 4-epimerase/fuculose-1-phosphate aldolase